MVLGVVFPLLVAATSISEQPFFPAAFLFVGESFFPPCVVSLIFRCRWYFRRLCVLFSRYVLPEHSFSPLSYNR